MRPIAWLETCSCCIARTTSHVPHARGEGPQHRAGAAPQRYALRQGAREASPIIERPGSIAVVQKILPIRREYNRWVGNQTLEDYALRFTATSARRWSNFRVANTALGSISFLALEAIGGAITLSYGFTNAFWAIVTVSALIFLTGLPISYYAAKYGVDMDLLTRGAGFGYIGSTITSLIYATFTFIFFAIEAAIMAHALKICLDVPLGLGYVLSSLAVIPLVIHGITLISRFQVYTQPAWLFLHLLPFVFILWHAPELFTQWRSFSGHLGDGDGSFNILLFGAAAAVAMALVVQIGEQVDFLRFLKQPERGGAVSWHLALVCAGPGWIIPGMLKLLAGSFLAFVAVQHQVPMSEAAEPTQMYLTAYGYVFDAPTAALIATGLFVVLSQLKINVTNAYAGSIAWSNFFARLTQSHPGRVVWVVFNVLIALLLTELGIFKALEIILGLYAQVAIAWVGALVADLVVNKPLGLSPKTIEFKRAHLYDINPVGIGAMSIATIASFAVYAGLLGETLQALSAFVAFGVAFIAAPVIAKATGGRYYLVRQPQQHFGDAPRACTVCEHTFEGQDLAHCPAYGGTICSLCCSLDVRCHDACRPQACIEQQARSFLGRLLAERALHIVDSRLGHYLARFAISIVLIATVIGLIYFQETLRDDTFHHQLKEPLFNLFMMFALIAGITSWLSVLAQESRRVAREESTRQNQLLMQEIEAHQKTDAELNRAKEAAEAANLAKSRYISGISHELRTPLNALLGYAQLLGEDDQIPAAKRGGIQVMKRSAEHLSLLIDGLLDMARIEAGKLVLRKDPLALPEFVDQLVQMFALQAHAKGLGLSLDVANPMPAVVFTDEKRLRQILINLLSNAIKYTQRGSVTLCIHYRRPLIEFEVKDTGGGIDAGELKRIFEPFERGHSAAGLPGTGLGLTISSLLAQVMGGDITVTSTPGQGSTFRVRLLLTAGERVAIPHGVEDRIVGYVGARKTVMVVDDDPSHRMLMRDVLRPLGFELIEATNGKDCMILAEERHADVVLLDISLPGLSGWDVLRALQRRGRTPPSVIMISANAQDNQHRPPDTDPATAFLVKPVVLSQLLAQLEHQLGLHWLRAKPTDTRKEYTEVSPAPPHTMAAGHVDELMALGRIGYVRAIETKLAAIARDDPVCLDIVRALEADVREFRLDRFMDRLQSATVHE